MKLLGFLSGPRFSIWFVKNIEIIALEWKALHWISVPTAIFLGAVSGIHVMTMAIYIFFIGVTLNIGAYLLVKAIEASLLSLKEGPDKELAHQALTDTVRRILR